jgi:AGCS family alanine or glycine:cation symporter
LAILFSVAGMFGALPVFQANQLTQTVQDVILIPNGIPDNFWSDLAIGIVITIIVSLVIFGGIRRIGRVAGKMVPAMVVIYVLAVLYIIFTNLSVVPESFRLIFEDAFSGDAVLGGAVGAVILTGVRRAAFSNEAGIGTAPMAHGAAKTNEPVREGLIAMLGPMVDTLIVCTMTALAIIITGEWQTKIDEGITVTVNAFDAAIPVAGPYILMFCILIFSFTSLFSFSYYGTKCLGFLVGAEYKFLYNYFYVGSIILAAVASLDAVIGLIDGMYATMAIPTMIGALLLAPKVRAAAKDYFRRMAEMKAES